MRILSPQRLPFRYPAMVKSKGWALDVFLDNPGDAFYFRLKTKD
jgi:hypothetical protein